jgi:hypothetical protein
MTIAIPTNVKRAVFCSVSWLVIQVMAWIYLGMYNSEYYSWGPSDDLILPFTNTVVDTWPRWTLLIINIVMSVSVNVYSADLFYPWMSSVALNPGVKLNHDKKHTWLVVNIFWATTAVQALFFFMLAYSQIDIAFVSAISAIITGMYSSRVCIYDPARDESEHQTQLLSFAGAHNNENSIDMSDPFS